MRRREVVAKMMTRDFVTTCDTRTDDYREVYIQVGSDNVTGSCNLRQSFSEKLNNNKFISILIFLDNNKRIWEIRDIMIRYRDWPTPIVNKIWKVMLYRISWLDLKMLLSKPSSKENALTLWSANGYEICAPQSTSPGHMSNLYNKRLG